MPATTAAWELGRAGGCWGLGTAVSVTVTWGLGFVRLSLKFAYFFLEPLPFLEPLGCPGPEGSIVKITTTIIKWVLLTGTRGPPARQELCSECRDARLGEGSILAWRSSAGASYKPWHFLLEGWSVLMDGEKRWGRWMGDRLSPGHICHQLWTHLPTIWSFLFSMTRNTYSTVNTSVV